MSDDIKKQAASSISIERKTEINLELDDDKIDAIKACLKKGRLSIIISDVDLGSSGRVTAPYLYD